MCVLNSKMQFSSVVRGFLHVCFCYKRKLILVEWIQLRICTDMNNFFFIIIIIITCMVQSPWHNAFLHSQLLNVVHCLVGVTSKYLCVLTFLSVFFSFSFSKSEWTKIRRTHRSLDTTVPRSWTTTEH